MGVWKHMVFMPLSVLKIIIINELITFYINIIIICHQQIKQESVSQSAQTWAETFKLNIFRSCSKGHLDGIGSVIWSWRGRGRRERGRGGGWGGGAEGKNRGHNHSLLQSSSSPPPPFPISPTMLFSSPILPPAYSALKDHVVSLSRNFFPRTIF